ncbi:MAG: hypothetical protein DCC52_19025 [Chloroflexi bacterium]|nr:MAG: hypothetical protein DCC52_19025 [Chloroflexota bacterium]
MNPLQKKGLLFKQRDNAFSFFSPLFARFVSEETGAPAPPAAPRLVFDAARGSVTVNAHTTQLKPTEAELFGYLWENRPRACSLGELLNVMLRVDAGAQLQARLERHLYHLAKTQTRVGKS